MADARALAVTGETFLFFIFNCVRPVLCVEFFEDVETFCRYFFLNVCNCKVRVLGSSGVKMLGINYAKVCLGSCVWCGRAASCVLFSRNRSLVSPGAHSRAD